jgi:PAS domain S-box-containing protein
MLMSRVQILLNQFYAFTPYLWPVIITLFFLVVVDVYSWRHRNVPGARWFAIALALSIVWIAGSGMYLIAKDPAAREFWFKFRAIWLLPIATVMLWFMLDFAGLGRWLTRRTLLLMALPSLIAAALIITNEVHNLNWSYISYDTGDYQIGIAGWALLVFAYLQSLVGLLVFTWLFIRSPQQRWPVAICILAQLITRTAFILDQFNFHIVLRLDTVILAFTVSTGLYALALFRFHMFDPIVVARTTVIEQMQEGMIVLDNDWKIVDLNPAVLSILSLPANLIRGQAIDQVLPGCQEIRRAALVSGDGKAGSTEICLGSMLETRYYSLHLSPLHDPQQQPLGHLLVIEDVTDAKQLQTQLLDQQRVMATLQERARLARELHDDTLQSMIALNQRIQLAQLTEDEKADRNGLEEIQSLTEQTIQNLRRLTRALRPVYLEDLGLVTALEMLARETQQMSDIDVTFERQGVEIRLPAPVELALYRIGQEALSNVVRHAHPTRATLKITYTADRVSLEVIDDGVGFEVPESPAEFAPSGHFGLLGIYERTEMIGAKLSIQSMPAKGCHVMVTVPT